MYELTIKAETFVELRDKLVNALTTMANPHTTKDQPASRPPKEEAPPVAAPVIPMVAPQAPPQAAPTIPLAPAPQYSQEQLSVAGVQLMDAGKENEIFALMDQFGVQMITQLKPEQYGQFAQALRSLGAQL